jgi:hypothetical protein
MKSNFLKYQRKQSSLSPYLSRGESKQIEAAWRRGVQRCSGFHEFCSSDDVKARIPGLVAERIEKKKEEAMHLNKPYEKEFYLTLLHSIKSELWNELTDEEQQNWRDTALDSVDEAFLSRDR